MATFSSAQRFDFDQANSLNGKLKSGATNLENELKRMMKDVEGVTNWWSGGSEQAFIQNFRTTKDKITTSLNQCLADYQKLVNDISKAKSDSDKAIADKLRV